MRVDSEQGTGTPAVVFDSSNLYRRLDAAQNQIAQAKQKKYQEFLGNLKEVYKGIGDAAELDIMTNDRPVIQKKMADIFGRISADPRGVLGGKGYAELQQDLAKLKFDAAESAKNNLFDKAHREFLARDPDLNTPENKKKLDDFQNQPLGARKAFELDMPGIFDPLALSKSIADRTKQDYAETKLSEDGKFVESTSGTKYDPQQWNAVAGGLYDLPDPRSGSLRNTIQQRFKALPQQVQDRYKAEKDPAKAYYLDLMNSFRPKDQIKKSSDKANPYTLLSKRQAFQEYLADKKQNFAQSNIRLRATLQGGTVNDSADFLVRQHASLLTGDLTPYEVTLNGKKEKGSLVPPPEFMKKIDDYVQVTKREGTNLDPTAQTIVTKGTPDLTMMTNDGGITAVWYQRDRKGNVIPSGDGGSKVEKDVHIPRRAWLTLESSVLPQKFKASAINAADEFYRKKGNALETMKEVQDADDLNLEQPQEKTQQKNEPTYKVQGKVWTESQLKKGADYYKMSIDEYKKQLGIK